MCSFINSSVFFNKSILVYELNEMNYCSYWYDPYISLSEYHDKQLDAKLHKLHILISHGNFLHKWLGYFASITQNFVYISHYTSNIQNTYSLTEYKIQNRNSQTFNSRDNRPNQMCSLLIFHDFEYFHFDNYASKYDIWI